MDATREDRHDLIDVLAGFAALAFYLLWIRKGEQ